MSAFRIGDTFPYVGRCGHPLVVSLGPVYVGPAGSVGQSASQARYSLDCLDPECHERYTWSHNDGETPRPLPDRRPA